MSKWHPKYSPYKSMGNAFRVSPSRCSVISTPLLSHLVRKKKPSAWARIEPALQWFRSDCIKFFVTFRCLKGRKLLWGTLMSLCSCHTTRLIVAVFRMLVRFLRSLFEAGDSFFFLHLFWKGTSQWVLLPGAPRNVAGRGRHIYMDPSTVLQQLIRA